MAKVYVPYEGPVVTRKDAKAQGKSLYFPGRLCKQGHISERYLSGNCTRCSYEIQNALYCADRPAFHAQSRAWAAANPDRTKEIRRKSYVANSDKETERARRFYSANRAECMRRARAWKASNKDHIREYDRRRAALFPDKIRSWNAEWRARNVSRIRERKREYRRLNSDRNRQWIAARRARKLSATGSHTIYDISSLLLKQKHKCIYCRVNLKRAGYHVDHKVALSRGGSNGPKNLQILCPPCNNKKHTADHFQYARKLGLLL